MLAAQSVRGLSLAAVLDGLNAQSPAAGTCTLAGGDELELTFTSDAERVCITFERDPSYIGEVGGAVLRVPANVRALSDDGRIDVELTVELSAQSVDGRWSSGPTLVGRRRIPGVPRPWPPNSGSATT